MEDIMRKSSIFHEVQALYRRNTEGKLLYVAGHQAEEISVAWPSILRLIQSGPNKKYNIASGQTVEILESEIENFRDSDGYNPGLRMPTSSDCNAHVLRVQELICPTLDLITGILSVSPRNDSDEAKWDLRNWFGLLITSETRLTSVFQPSDAQLDEGQRFARDISDIFDSTLRNVGTDDQWISGGGRAYFENRVLHYTSRNIKIEFCLPAFPCKSSNPEKTAGADPDLGEEIALQRLAGFVDEVGRIYRPGAKIWVVSDGHVFADCIGVHDDVVDQYNKTLGEMKKRICDQGNRETPIDFLSLEDLFFANRDVAALFCPDHVRDFDLPHFLSTRLTEAGELCRRLMMVTCQPSSDVFRSQVKGQDKSSLALYRGFSKFMLEDISLHPSTAALSRARAKKLSAKIAYEMIKRNQAYSNLVELLFPAHIRLSIHAHNNQGPKFGIRLLSAQTVRPLALLSPELEPATAAANGQSDILHIPTPWHNAILEIEGHDTRYIVKSKIVLKALKSQVYLGGWVKDGQCRSGRFVLRKSNLSSTQPLSHTATSAGQDYE